MEAIGTVRELIRKNNLNLTCYSQLEISFPKDTSEVKRTISKKKRRNNAENSQKWKFKALYARKNEDIKKRKGNLNQKSISFISEDGKHLGTSRKSDSILDEEKRVADTQNNIIPIKILNRPSPIK